MSEFVLETKNLGISFGGLRAVSDVNLQIKPGEIYGLIGPNGAGKTTIFNLLTGVYQPTEGTFYLNGKELRHMSQERINHEGIARTFQNIRLFNNMTVRRNVMVGLHNRPEFRCTMLDSILRLPRHFKVEKELKEKAVEITRAVTEKQDGIGCFELSPECRLYVFDTSVRIRNNQKLHGNLLKHPRGACANTALARLMYIIARNTAFVYTKGRKKEKKEMEKKRTAHQMNRWAVEKIWRLFLIVRNSSIFCNFAVGAADGIGADG